MNRLNLNQSIIGFLVVLLSLSAVNAYAGPEFDELMQAISSSDPKSDPKTIQEILKNAEKKGKINLNEKRADGWSPLCLAAAKGNAQIVQELLNHGTDLGATVDFQNKKATPFILAAQYNHPDVMELILKSPSFTADNLKQEVRNANTFKQPELTHQLLMVRPKAGSQASCPSRDEFASDVKAQTYRIMDVSCAVCLGLPGEGNQTKLIDGSSHTGDSAITDCCGQFFCKNCLEKAAATKISCPNCRQKNFTFQVSKNTIAQFQWAGSNKVPLPGQRIQSSQVAAPEVQGQGGVMERFRAQFVQIPAGRLPDGTQIAAHEADKFPATRELWNEIWGDMPADVPADQRATWNQCPRCPVTHVNWENQNRSSAEVQEFLGRLNQREAVSGSGCTYDLPTDKQLHYDIRADVTGTNQDIYSAGVNGTNVNDYVTHWGNSNRQIQPVGQKTLNGFGLELGNIWKMSKDLYDSAHPEWGRSVRGGSWGNDVSLAKSGNRNYAIAGNRGDRMGFSLVRTCR